MIGHEAAQKSGKSPEIAAQEMLRNLETAKSGSFLSWDGKIIPF